VIIYFDKESKKVLVDRIAENLKPGGYLFIGHSESLFRVSDRFELVGKTIYRKTKGVTDVDNRCPKTAEAIARL
jgi:chemotaxis protein methyltransferase CheR